MRVKILMLFIFVFGIGVNSIIAQTLSVKGNVTDEGGTPLPGVSVVIKGTSKGVATDFDGNYELQAKAGDVLEFSSIGFQSQSKKVLGGGNVLIINVLLIEEASQIEEVVVVGHGVQKKASVTGAITSVKGAELRMPTSSLTTALAGQLSGVIINTASGEPGALSNFYIRGIGTFGGRATPLIMLDDVEISAADLNNIPAETIESFSILKDASATAIYGSRGANGVMIVKTKNGNKEERTRIGVTYEQSFNTPVNFPDFVDGPTYMELYNEALLARNPSAMPRYSKSDIENTRSGINPYVFPNVDWKEVLFRDMSLNHRANINIQGGGNKATYYMSVQANHDEGLLNTSEKVYSWDNNISRWAYNFQNNIAYNLSEGTKIELRMNAQIRKHIGTNQSTDDIFKRLLFSNPVEFPIQFPARPGDTHIRFGSYEFTAGSYRENPYAEMLRTFKEQRQNTLNTSLKVSQDFDFITKGLSSTVLINFKTWSTNYYDRSIQPYIYRVKDRSYDAATNTFEMERLGTSGTDYINQSAIARGADETFVLQATLDYQRQFGYHNLAGMLLYNQREYKSDVLPHRNQGVSGRLTYNYASKYLTEFNFGYTGTERLKKGMRFEFFPAASVGWVVSEEKFFEPLRDIVQNFKLRASYGLIGSDETGLEAGAAHFLYINEVNFNPTGGVVPEITMGESLNVTHKGPRVTRWAVDDARWEKVKKFNVGVDLKLFDELNITADYFYDKRYDILMKRESWPDIFGYGAAIPWGNLGKVDNWGYEFSANWGYQVNSNLYIGLRGNFTYTQNKYVSVDLPEYQYPWLARTGYPLSYTFGYIAEGLFKSQEEIDNSPSQVILGSIPRPGDIKYRDITGDGVIDTSDRTMISQYGTTPRVQYGFGFNVVYKKIDLNVFFNGSAKRTIMTGLMSPFAQRTGQTADNVFQYIADNRWTESNPDPNATYPRLGLLASDVANNNQTSTYWMRDGSFLRFKTLELGYKFKYGRVFATANNLAVFSSFKQWDPELEWFKYPLQRTYSMGVQLNF